MPIILRKYQDIAIEKVRDSFRKGNKAPCLVLPTGGGKQFASVKLLNLL